MHTFSKEDKEKLDILWSLFQQLKGQVAYLLASMGWRNVIFATTTAMQNDPAPWENQRIFQVVQTGAEHQYWFDSSSTATADGVTILNSNVTTQGRFIQLL